MIQNLAGQLRNVPVAIWVVALTALALVLRIAGLAAHSLWFDEAFTWLAAQQPAWAILTQRLEPFLPPLYHLLLHFWSGLGESEALMRSLSVIFGVLTIPAMYALGRELFGPTVGLGAAVLTAVSPFHIYYSQQLRFYSLVIILSALMLWAFVRAWRSDRYREWIVFGLLAGLSLYAHYFVVLSLAVLHGFACARRRLEFGRWRGLLVADLLTIVVVGPLLPSAWIQTQQVTSSFWLSPPSPLESVRTLDYLLFGHTTPIWLVPAALFFTLSVSIFTAWAAVRACDADRPWLFLLIALVLGPMLLVLLVSWIISPIYLDRSFSLVTPAYMSLLSWGFVRAPRRFRLRYLYAGLAIVVLVSLGNHYLGPDPAKPPFREVGRVLTSGWQEGDVLLNLHDSSYLPLRYYAPQLRSYLLNNDPDAWIPAHTWEWAGQRVSSLDSAMADTSRLWLVIMPVRMNDRQAGVLNELEARYHMKQEWSWSSPEPVEIRLYSLDDTSTGG